MLTTDLLNEPHPRSLRRQPKQPSDADRGPNGNLSPCLPESHPLAQVLKGGPLGGDDGEFVREGIAFRNDLAPRDMAERLQVDLALVAIYEFRQLLPALIEAPPGDRDIARAQQNALKLLKSSCEQYDKLRARADGGERPLTIQERLNEILRIVKLCEEDCETPDPNWRNQLEVPLDPPDEARDETWPRVKGTNITAEEVICRLLEGHPPATLFFVYSALTPADIRACKGCDAEKMCGPEPLPPRIPLPPPWPGYGVGSREKR
jgi:hypothetical protein